MARSKLHQHKKLIIRLSSLGDVILAMSALEVVRASHVQADWVVAREYADLLRGHPAIGRVWEFDRKSGFRGWKQLSQRIWSEGYDEVYDLHSTLRSRLLQFLFFVWGIFQTTHSIKSWKRISKQRLRLYGYFLFKARWPKNFRPESMVSRSARILGGTGKERPDLSHLLLGFDGQLGGESPALQGLLDRLKAQPYFCVMPGSRWDGKKWPVEKFLEFIRELTVLPVILGTSADVESQQLMTALELAHIPYVSGVGSWKLQEVARILSGAIRYFGNDTGLAHLAEAVGVPAWVVFGPTVSDMGFGPWRSESQSIGLGLACRPCGKDGRYCWRPVEKFKCMNFLNAQTVLAVWPRGERKGD